MVLVKRILFWYLMACIGIGAVAYAITIQTFQ